MSETIATRMVVTVSPVRRLSRVRAVGPLILAAAMAEAGVRLLSPRERPIRPAALDVEQYFSSQEMERGADFARPQLALALARSTLELGVMATLVRRSQSRAPRRRAWRPSRTRLLGRPL